MTADDSARNRVQEAYERARRDQSRGSLPQWEDLSLPMREAFTEVFFAGRTNAMEDEARRDRLRKRARK
jgi:hypothetical protein